MLDLLLTAEPTEGADEDCWLGELKKVTADRGAVAAADELRLLRALEAAMVERRALWKGCMIAPQDKDQKALDKIAEAQDALREFREPQAGAPS
jgi:hypothetical protein